MLDEERLSSPIKRTRKRGKGLIKAAGDTQYDPAKQKIIDEIRLNYVSGEHPSSFGGINQVAKHYPNVPRAYVVEALAGIDTYTLQRPVKRPRYYNPIFVRQKRKLMQSDLISFARPDNKYAKANKGLIYLLVVIDSFTRYVWIKLLINKDAGTMLKALSEMSKEMRGGFGEELMCDQGGEYINKKVMSWLDKMNIKLVKTNNKAPTVERFNQTFQNMLYKWMEYYQTDEYVDAVPMFLRLYNNEKYHRIIGMTPQEAEDPVNEAKLLSNLEHYYTKAVGADKRNTPIKPVFKVGDLVRVSRYKRQFDKGYHRNFQPTIYQISRVFTHLPVPQYKLSFDSNGREEEGRWYGNELQLVSSNYTDGLAYKGTVVKERKRSGHPREQLIDYTYWPGEKYQQWQFIDDVRDYTEEKKRRHSLKG